MFPSLPHPPRCTLRKQQFKGTVASSWSGVPSLSEYWGGAWAAELPLGESLRCQVQLPTLQEECTHISSLVTLVPNSFLFSLEPRWGTRVKSQCFF